jgi:uncharacterized protein (DUF3820 family)
MMKNSIMSSKSFNDQTPMPWGKYKGTALANVPAEYLIWLYDNNKAYGKLLFYIHRNMDVLHADAAREKAEASRERFEAR